MGCFRISSMAAYTTSTKSAFESPALTPVSFVPVENNGTNNQSAMRRRTDRMADIQTYTQMHRQKDSQ